MNKLKVIRLLRDVIAEFYILKLVDRNQDIEISVIFDYKKDALQNIFLLVQIFIEV